MLLKPGSPTPLNVGNQDRAKDTERHKGSTLLRSSRARRRKRVPMSNQSTTSNTRRRIRKLQYTAKRMH